MPWFETAKRQILATVTVDIASVGAGLTVDTAVAVPGAKPGNVVAVNPPSTIEANLIVAGAWVSNDDEVTIRVHNPTAGAIDPASADWVFAISY